MAHFAQVNEDNIVINVVVVPNEQEHRGQEFMAEDLGLGGKWIQTSYNNRIRNIFACIGYWYLPDKDVFVAPRPYPSWELNEDFEWEAPVPHPIEGPCAWDEDLLEWVTND